MQTYFCNPLLTLAVNPTLNRHTIHEPFSSSQCQLTFISVQKYRNYSALCFKFCSLSQATAPPCNGQLRRRAYLYPFGGTRTAVEATIHGCQRRSTAKTQKTIPCLDIVLIKHTIFSASNAKLCKDTNEIISTQSRTTHFVARMALKILQPIEKKEKEKQ